MAKQSIQEYLGLPARMKGWGCDNGSKNTPLPKDCSTMLRIICGYTTEN